MLTADEKQRDALCAKIIKATGRAIGDFNLIENGDRIAVGMSGGKDSYTLLQVLEILRRKAPVTFTLVPVNIDSGFTGYRNDLVREYLQEAGFSCHIKSTAAYRIIAEKRRPGSSYCAFCARLRRGALYTAATELNCNKIALGHHMDDVIETLLLNQFYSGSLGAMSPRVEADNGQHTVIRPMIYVEEELIRSYSQLANHPIIRCSCPVEGAPDQKRQQIKQLIERLSAEVPHLRRSLLGAAGNVHPHQLLDRSLFDYSPQR
ncbi:MAG: tRNA 2-thiocytidine(32) synthetase TtcA [Desulfuromonas sp.]|nr:MAG: tRNA 2-thiocytidine(32) synthetase TtcA [Desulfuromonas sp.]